MNEHNSGHLKVSPKLLVEYNIHITFSDSFRLLHVLAQRKATALKGLPLFMREKSGSFLKSCLVSVCFQSISIRTHT